MIDAPRAWVRAPRKAIPKAVRAALRTRLEKHVQVKWRGQCRQVLVRFRGAFAYVDAVPTQRQHLPDTHSGRRALADATPTRLCRLGYLGRADRWEYAFFKYSDEKYALSLLASGSFEAGPEQEFDAPPGVYLRD